MYFAHMNYLAHLYLSGENSELMAGNFLTDFLNLHEVQQLPEALQPGVKLHREIDDFTDNHPIVKELNAELRTSQGKYAPVALDIVFDYLLYHNWDRYSEVEYEAFCQVVYITIHRFLQYVPEKECKHIQRMIDSRWLSVYCSISGLNKIMEGMDRRTRFPSQFKKAIQEVEGNFSYYDNQFNLFFPDIVNHVARFMDKLKNIGE